MGEFFIKELAIADYQRALRWIHIDLPEDEFEGLFKDAYGRMVANNRADNPSQSNTPAVEQRYGQKRVAACYFRTLAGRVATLGGVRAVDTSYLNAASELISIQIKHLQAQAVPQIQAVVREHDRATRAILMQADFHELTWIRHVWLDLSSPNHALGLSTLPSARDGTQLVNSEKSGLDQPTIVWRPAVAFAKSRVTDLIEATFQQTLDCPQMNGLRDKHLVMDGFLEGRPFRSLGRRWDVLLIDGSPVGCIMLTEHPNQLSELTYMGLVPTARGQGLGRVLLQRAIQRSRDDQARTIVAAVDEKNWPALGLYQQFGFQCHQRMSVWLFKQTENLLRPSVSS